MKKIFTLLVVFLTTMLSVNAQYLLQEGFETGTIPTGWTIVDNDGDGYNWDPTYLLQEDGAAHTGEGMIASASYINNIGALTPDNWLITPAINITVAADLSFWVKGQDANYVAENYSVYVSTSSTIADFTATTAVLTGTTTNDWEQKIVDLSSYVGQTVYIAFRHHDCYDQMALAIYNVTVSATEGTTENNSAAVNIFPNPTNGIVNVEGEGILSIEVIDVTGRVVLIQQGAESIDMSQLPNGVYAIRTLTEKGTSLQKVMKR